MNAARSSQVVNSENDRSLVTATLAVLTLVNLLNYLDRYVLSSVLPWIESDFDLADRQSGLLGSVFIIAFLLAAPVSGYLGDRTQRTRLLAAGVFLWSLATIASGLAQDYASLVVTRALIGIGEAGYAVVAPGLIADLYRERHRARVLAWFYAAVPVGSALGYMVGGTMGQAFGWRWAFIVAGIPGLLMTIPALLLREPRRGASDESVEAGPPLRPGATLRRLLYTPAWRHVTVSLTLANFSVGGLAFWMPTFLVRTQGMRVESAAFALGLVLVAAGLIGTLMGGWLGDRALRRWTGGHMLVGAGALLGCAPFIAAMPFLPVTVQVLAFSFVALLLMAVAAGPVNAVLVGCVPAGLRSGAVALNTFALHLFGDAASPYVLGWVSDGTGLRVATSLTAIPVLIGGAVLAWGALQVNRDPQGIRRYTG